MAYRIPDLAGAFNKYLNTDIANVTTSLRHASDYTLHRDSWAEYPLIRGMTSIINWKSNVNNADLTYNLRVGLDADLVRGDMVYDPETGFIGIVNWNVDKMVDCKRTQVTTCNIRTTVYRNVPEKVDETGYLVEDAHRAIIVDNMPCIYTEMYGRFEYIKTTNTPGISPDQTIEVKMQANKETLQIKSGDLFYVHGILHKIMVVNYSQLNMDGDKGVLIVICERGEAD